MSACHEAFLCRSCAYPHSLSRLVQALYACREAPPPDWPAPAFVLIGREDLATARLGTPPSDTPLLTPPYGHHLRPIEPLESDEAFEGSGNPPGDGMEPAAAAQARARFRTDLRLDEVRRLLGSAQPVAVRVTGGPELADPDLVAHQQTLLWQVSSILSMRSILHRSYAANTIFES